MSQDLETAGWFKRTVSDAQETGHNLLSAAYDHVHNASTAQLAVEGVAVAAVAATAVALWRRPGALKTAATAIKSEAETLPELGKGMLPANLGRTGVDLRYAVKADNLTRAVTVHLPPGFKPEKPHSVYYLLDGVQVNNPAGNMLKINGWAKTADAHQLVVVNLEQSELAAARIYGVTPPKSMFGKEIPRITGWNIDHGLLNKKPGFDDVNYFEAVYNGMHRSVWVRRDVPIGFSDGGAFAHLLAARMPQGSLDGIATVAGTVMKDSTALPKPGMKGFFVHSVHDPTIPIDGGAGPQLTRWLPKTGNSNIHQSRPLLQEARFAEANGITDAPKITDTAVYTLREYTTSASDQVKIQAFRLKKGGHTWPGRESGEGTNTAMTKANGELVSREEFPTNELIVKFFEQGRTVKRSL